MSVKVTSNPSAELPGTVIGKPVRLPHIMMCTQGERFCGRYWVASTQRELPVKMAERRRHEQGCAGGLIVAAAGQTVTADDVTAVEPAGDTPWWTE
jgi:hypothetical protein